MEREVHREHAEEEEVGDETPELVAVDHELDVEVQPAPLRARCVRRSHGRAAREPRACCAGCGGHRNGEMMSSAQRAVVVTDAARYDRVTTGISRNHAVAIAARPAHPGGRARAGRRARGGAAPWRPQCARLCVELHVAESAVAPRHSLQPP